MKNIPRQRDFYFQTSKPGPPERGWRKIKIIMSKANEMFFQTRSAFAGMHENVNFLLKLIQTTTNNWILCYHMKSDNKTKRSMRKIKWFLILILGLTMACSKNSTGNLYTPTSADATANATLTELQDGRTLYINNCGSCHNLYSPDDYSVSGWKSILSNMAPKTRMTTAQVTLVTKYLTRGKQ